MTKKEILEKRTLLYDALAIEHKERDKCFARINHHERMANLLGEKIGETTKQLKELRE